MQLQRDLGRLEAAGITLAAVSYDDVEVLRTFAEAREIGFALLSDPESRTIDAYGVRNREATGRTAGIPHPGFFLIDREGVVRGRLFGEGYRERPTPEELLEAAAATR